MLLAAGFGKRLQPLTSAIPKPLIPLWNRPLIDHIILMLKSNGVKEIVVNAHWLSDILESHIKSAGYGLKIHFSPESEIRGTGGALAPWRELFSDAPFWVINADIAASFDLKLLMDAYDSIPNLVGACWVTDKKGPRTVELDFAGRITCYRSPEPGIDGTYTFCGAQLLSPKVFDYIKDSTFSTLVDSYENAMGDNLFIKGVNIPGSYWNDAGTLQRYHEIHMDTKRLALTKKPGGEFYDPKADLLHESRSGFFCVGPDAQVASDVKGTRSIVFNGVTLEKGTSLKNSIIQGGTLNGKFSDTCCISGESLRDIRVKDAAEALGWKANDSAFAFLGQRGSNRSFWRGFHHGQRSVFVIDNGGRPENTRYAEHTQILKKADVPVPELLYVSEDLCTLALEDMGTTSLSDKVEHDPERIEKLYRAVLKEVAGFHRNVTAIVKAEGVDLEPAFDAALYQWECELFEEHLLKARYGYESLPAEVRAELNDVAADLTQGSSVVIHRDLQSSNILFKGRNFAFIDYQGMRFGLPAYDIASLLYDPYVKIDTQLRCKLAAEYAAMMPECPDVTPLFFKGAVQRLVQSLGAFGRLSGLGHSSFKNHILQGLENLLEAADAAELDALGGLVEELIAREGMRV